MRTSLALVILAAALLGAGGAAKAAGFNCAKAKTPDEKAICADRRINDMDVEMAVRLDVAKHLLAKTRRAELFDDQASWVQARRTCRADKACLIRHYHDRLLEIDGALEKVYRKGPF